jgi:ribosomal protein S1
MIEEIYHVGQLVEGRVSRVAQFGAFVSLDPGIEALLHISQMAEPQPEHPSLVVHEGQRLLMRVISIEPDKQRLGLSLKEVAQEEQSRWSVNRRSDDTTEEVTEEIAVETETEVEAEPAQLTNT